MECSHREYICTFHPATSQRASCEKSLLLLVCSTCNKTSSTRSTDHSPKWFESFKGGLYQKTFVPLLAVVLSCQLPMDNFWPSTFLIVDHKHWPYVRWERPWVTHIFLLDHCCSWRSVEGRPLSLFLSNVSMWILRALEVTNTLLWLQYFSGCLSDFDDLYDFDFDMACFSPLYQSLKLIYSSDNLIEQGW